MIAEVHGREQNSLPSLESGNVFANVNDLACDVAAKDMGQRDLGNSFSNPEIKMVHGAGPYAHQDLVFAQTRLRYFFVPKHLRPASFVNAHGFHGSSWRKIKLT